MNDKTAVVSTEHITDDYMRERLAKARTFTLLVLRPTPALSEPNARPIVWEHGRRNMALQAAGVMAIVCPVGDEQISGIAIFNTGVDEAAAFMADDPGVQAGIFTFDLHPCRGFPGDALPS
jgi:hypothetical protein